MKLNEFAVDFTRALFAQFPWMREYARVDDNPQVQQGTLLVEFSPSPLCEDCLFWISTIYDEVTIGFGRYYHDHFR